MARYKRKGEKKRRGELFSQELEHFYKSERNTHTHTHTHTHIYIYIGSGPNQEEFVGSQRQNHFLDLERRRV